MIRALFGELGPAQIVIGLSAAGFWAVAIMYVWQWKDGWRLMWVRKDGWRR